MTPVHNHTACCSGCPSETRTDPFSGQFFRILEKVSAIAIGIFSAFVSLELFVPFFLVGTGIGLYQHFYYDEAARTASASSVSCAQGLMEQLTGAKLPPLISLFGNLAIAGVHIEHHSSVFVPVMSVTLGTWVGQTLGSLSPGRVQLPTQA